MGIVKGFFRPSELGFIVNDLLIESFPDILNVDFTARMEDHLDKIEEGEIDKAVPACKNTRSLNAKATSKAEPTGVKCPEKGCDGELVARRSRRGKLF